MSDNTPKQGEKWIRRDINHSWGPNGETVEIVSVRKWSRNLPAFVAGAVEEIEEEQVVTFTETEGHEVHDLLEFMQDFDPEPPMQIGVAYDTNMGWMGFIPMFINDDGSVLGRFPIGKGMWDVGRIAPDDVSEYYRSNV